MKYIISILIILSVVVNAKEYSEFVIKFKKYDKSIVKSYEKKYYIRKYFSLSNEKLLDLKLNGEKLSGEKLADLRTYFLIKLSPDVYREIISDNNISIIYKNIKNIPRPLAVDITPTTPSWVSKQGYIYDFSTSSGLNARYAWQFNGGSGENVTVVDIEGGWTTEHEDLGIEEPNLYDENGINLTGTPMDGANHNDNHGTSVLGEIASINNNYGTTGIANKSKIKVINDYSAEYGYSTADAIIRGISVLDKGSILLLESQKGGPNYHYDSTDPESQYGLVPDEWLQAEFDAIKTATTNGFIIIEAGANGTQNLDDEIYNTCKGDLNTYESNKSGKEPCFDVNTRDSGAIIVGAGNPPRGNWGIVRKKMYYTSYGKRVDVQAWGMEIYTTGYGDLFYPNNDIRQAYTTQFGGTSGASPMIAGVSAVLQSRYKEKNNNQILTSKQIRAILKDPSNSRPQNGNELIEHIGPQPDLELIFRNYLNDEYDCNPRCNDWEYCRQIDAICLVKENRCNRNDDCSNDLDCNKETHKCVNPCTLLSCNEWEYCKERACNLKSERCENNNNCKETEACNPSVHKCVDPCLNLICQEHSTCKRFEKNSRAECVCDENYLLNSEKICEYVKPTTLSKKDSNCNYGGRGSFVNIIIIFFLFLFYKKRYKFKNIS